MKKGLVYLASFILLVGSITGLNNIRNRKEERKKSVIEEQLMEIPTEETREVQMENQRGNRFSKEVKEQILAFDWKGLSEKILYPIQIGDTIYETKEAFAAENFTFQDEFRKRLETETYETMFVNWQDTILEEKGSVWTSLDYGFFYSELSTGERKLLAINGLLSQGAAEEQRTILSMEEVIALADQPKNFLVLNEELREYWIHNAKEDLDEKTLDYATTYSIWHQGEEYLLDIVYRKKRAELAWICLRRVSDGEQIFLYDAESAYRKIHLANGEEVVAYLEKHKQMSDYFTAEMPKNLTIEPYHAQIGYGGGSCLISSDAADNAYLEELMVYAEREKLPLPAEWYSIGGMCCYNDCVDWEGDQISHISLGSIHSYPTGERENLEECEVPACLVMMGQDLFTTVFLEEAEKKYGEIPREKQVVRQWYVYFAKPDSRDVYVIWLNADLYSKEEIIQFAESVRFTEQAFQNSR